MSLRRAWQEGSFWVEAVLMLSGGWAAKCLRIGPGNLDGRFAEYYRLVRHLEPNERFWGDLALSGSALLLCGLVVSGSALLEAIAVMLRLGGLAALGTLFVVLGTSWLAASTDSIAGGIVLLLGLVAWAILALRAGVLAPRSSRPLQEGG